VNFRAVFHLVSFLPIVLGIASLTCWAVGARMGDPWAALRAFALTGALSLLAGSILWTLTRGPVDLNRRDGVGVVAFGWLLCTLIGAIPFVLSGVASSLADGWFESVSGFTTTGATVLDNLESLPRAILLWRSISQFMGGMGILVLCVAILPLLGSGGMQIYRAEAAGPSKDRLTPRIAVTAKLLWGVYVGLTALAMILLRLAGLSWFDAICHALCTTATGGFSTRTASIAAFENPAVEWIVIAFMFVAGVNFALHWRVLRGEWQAWFRDTEWRLYVFFIVAASVAIAVDTLPESFDSTSGGIRRVLFVVVSIMTTSGFTTDDYGLWPGFSQFVLVTLMIIGGCAGSTAGGLKVVRVWVLLKLVSREMKLFIQPRAIFHIKIGRQVVDSEVVSMIAAFFVILAFIGAAASALMVLFVPDLKTAISAVVSCLGNVGPGLGAIDPSGTYAFMPSGAKVLLSMCMLLGRLELYTLLVILIPGFWRR
jgi:trk system potassium uptake protein TrkH